MQFEKPMQWETSKSGNDMELMTELVHNGTFRDRVAQDGPLHTVCDRVLQI